jgi:replicative DNA helicase
VTDTVASRSTAVVTAAEAFGLAEARAWTGQGTSRTWPTGFTPLDGLLGGGLQAGDLALVAGPQGTGKTTMALQVARNVCAAGGEAVYLCYEHSPEQLFEKLLVMEMALHGGPLAPSHEEVRRRLSSGRSGLGEAIGDLHGAPEGLASLEGWSPRLHLVGARGDVTGLQEVRELAGRTQGTPLVVVDYLQKVYAGDLVDEDVRVSRIATGLKDLALELECPVVAVAAVDRAGLDARRIRARHLKGSVTLAYEADVVLVLQDKFDIVARQHLVYDLAGAQDHHRWVVCSVEKNRHGRDHGALEFHKRLTHAHLDPNGRLVEQELVDERVHLE